MLNIKKAVVVSLVLSFFIGTLFSQTTKKQSPQGIDKETAIVLFPLPFEQTSDEFTINTNNSCWFLFYAQKGKVYNFQFKDQNNKSELKVEIIGNLDKVMKSSSIVFTNNNTVLTWQAEESGNFYLKITLQKNGPFKGKFDYIINMKSQS